ncbi:MAG TPA: cupredoxin family copper-binding protein [Candidatus Angelobacter sp.]|nr:cupredoxin family copper-binding protein [Candidatus Angelobacter sp.]
MRKLVVASAASVSGSIAIVATVAAGLALGISALAVAPAPVRAETEHQVEIHGFFFAPSTLRISVGDTVTWTNEDSAYIHTATRSGVFDSGPLRHGESWSWTFTEAGTFNYQCTPHPWMIGRIIVEAADGASDGGSVPNTAMANDARHIVIVAGLAIALAALAVAGVRARRRSAGAGPITGS